MIQVESVYLNYRQPRLFAKSRCQPVLENVSFSIQPGETLGVIGRNGAGKSSLLKLLAGVIAPDSGSIQSHDSRVVLLSYQLGFNRALTGRENAIHSALLQGLSREEIEDRMDEVISFSGLDHAIDDRLGTYSSGMKARLGFAVATQSNADVILVDEALGVGDHAFKEKSAAFMKQWIKTNKTVVLVSHDENAIESLCSRVIWLEGGRLVANGPPEEIVQSYYDYDHLVANFSKAFGMTEEEVRAHENNRDPIKRLNTFRAGLRKLWNNEDRQEDPSSPVRFCRPRKGKGLRALVSSECGLFSWVENGRVIVEGDESLVREIYECSEDFSLDMANKLDQSREELQKTAIYRNYLSLVAGAHVINPD